MQNQGREYIFQPDRPGARLSVAIACGGTGGHIFPGMATGDVLQERGHDVTLWMTGRRLEQEAAATWGGAVETVPSEGFMKGVSFSAVRTVYRLWRAKRISRRRMKHARPDVLLAMGSYASVGPARAAISLNIPVVLHEANVVPGKAVAFLSGRAHGVAASFEETRFYLRRAELHVTGMPLRRELEAAARLSHPRSFEERPFELLIMGGSRGARRLNEVVVAALEAWPPDGPPIHVTHLTGQDDREWIESRYRDQGLSHEVKSFHHDMASVYSRAHLAICRAGASTCAELTAFGLPALLVPYPHATRDHQRMNAQALEKVGAVDVVDEAHCRADWLSEYLQGFIARPDRLRRMSRAARNRGPENPSEALADYVESIAATAMQEDDRV